MYISMSAMNLGQVLSAQMAGILPVESPEKRPWNPWVKWNSTPEYEVETQGAE